ncbi:VWA domain-containing protein [soil metagenome]
MKQENIFSSRWSAALLVIASLIFSACGDTAKTGLKLNDDLARTPQTTQEYTYAANTSANAASGMLYESESRSGVGERYAEFTENPFLETSRAPLSTFSIDVDTAAYANVRRFLNDGQLPPKDAVRIEEMINYFDYEYPQPAGGLPFSVHTEVATSPWNSTNKLMKIGLQGRKVSLDNTPPANLVFLLDVSGSMNAPNKLPLLKEGLRIMVDQLKPQDRVAIAVYAGSSGLVLPSTPVSQKGVIIAALNELEAGGATNGGQGIQLAYSVAAKNFIRGGNNRVILATDGDFNVGATSDESLVQMVEEKRKGGVFLSVLGFGSGNLNDSMMEKLSNKGNGNYAYIDSRDEARRALGEQVAGTLYTIAKDVKIQVEFNPALVAGYRLIGYENRMLADRDFNDDTKDAGEIGAGHSVTALYEIVPAGHVVDNGGIELKYSKVEATGTRFGDEMATVKLRYKDPDDAESKLLSIGVLTNERAAADASADLRFAAAVAQFGMLLTDSRYKGSASFRSARQLAQSSIAGDAREKRAELLSLIDRAASLNRRG